MINVEVTKEVWKKAKNLKIEKKLKKQIGFLKLGSNPPYPSLRLQPYVELKNREVWKFEIDLNWWGLTIKTAKDTIKIYNIIHHP